MAKKKQKPDFSKPKLKKADSADADTVAESPEWNEDDTNEEAPEDSAYKAEVKAAGYDTSKYYVNLPTVVIAGRPNVGKSTLFNRFMHRRLAIVDPTPGVTRDPVEAMAFIMGKPVHLVDTGGYKLDRDPTSRESEMDELVVQKTVATIKTADKILLLLESGVITGEDEEFIHLLRPYWNRLIVAVNKCEGGKGEDVSWNYLQYGFKELVFISADHGDHITYLYQGRIEWTGTKDDILQTPCQPLRDFLFSSPILKKFQQ